MSDTAHNHSASGTAALDEPIIAQVVRNGFVESKHRGHIAVTNPDGSLAFSRGMPDVPVMPRSANKPLQALAMVRAGLELPPRLLALVCSSHSGEPFHVEAAREILSRYGLTEDDLQNIPDLPVDEEERLRWIRSGQTATHLANNCSGKHSGMVATCVVNGWDTKSYLDPQHPLQQHIAETLADIASEPIVAIAIDGCGAPVMSLTPHGLARAFGRVAMADPDTPEGAIATAIRQYPEMIAGTHRDNTKLIAGTKGLIAKDGAEAVYAVGLSDGRGVALKISDGGQRARPVVMAAVLRRMGVQSSALDILEYAPVLGHGATVGAVVAVGITDD